jgi:hypothetical protein
MILTWKQTLRDAGHVMPGTHIDKFFDGVVVPSGYRYFSWNGRIYEVIVTVDGSKKSYRQTRFIVGDDEEIDEKKRYYRRKSTLAEATFRDMTQKWSVTIGGFIVERLSDAEFHDKYEEVDADR